MNPYFDSLKRLYPNILSASQAFNAIGLNLITPAEFYNLVNPVEPETATTYMKQLVTDGVITESEYEQITGEVYSA